MSRQSLGLGRDPGSRADVLVVLDNEANITLNEFDHANRIVVLNLASTDGQTVTLPPATGSGQKYTIINRVVQTQSILITAAGSGDIMTGVALISDSTAVATNIESFSATAADYRCTWKGTDGTTGGKMGDMFEAWDMSASLWLVRVLCRTTGTVATPFS